MERLSSGAKVFDELLEGGFEKDILTTNKKTYGVIINTNVIQKTNEGNVITKTETVVKKNVLSRLFTNFSPEPNTVEREGFAADYVTDGEEAAPAEIPQPQIIARPDNERVVDALKRLSASYPMLEKKKLLDKASTLVAQHVMFAKPAKEVIDEIEKLFVEAYDKFVSEHRRR